MELAQYVARYVGWDLGDLQRAIDVAPFSYKRYVIPKRTGGWREILHPAKTTKAIQYALLDLVVEKCNVHSAAMGYRKDLRSPLRANALLHIRFTNTVRLDLRNFFPCIRPEDLFAVLDESWQGGKFTAADRQFIAKGLFAQRHTSLFLTIGAPSSPSVSNAVMHSLDCRFAAYADSVGGCYTRYADDIIFSANTHGDCKDFVAHVADDLERTLSPRLQLNVQKTRYMSRATRRILLGLMLTPDGRVTIPRSTKRYIRHLIFRGASGAITVDEQTYVRGFLAYARDVEPSWLDRLCRKYRSDTVSCAMSGLWTSPANADNQFEKPMEQIAGQRGLPGIPPVVMTGKKKGPGSANLPKKGSKSPESSA